MIGFIFYWTTSQKEDLDKVKKKALKKGKKKLKFKGDVITVEVEEVAFVFHFIFCCMHFVKCAINSVLSKYSWLDVIRCGICGIRGICGKSVFTGRLKGWLKSLLKGWPKIERSWYVWSIQDLYLIFIHYPSHYIMVTQW